MSLDLWFTLSGDEIWNNNRTVCYINAGIRPDGFELIDDCDLCPELGSIIDGGPYQLPNLDTAPWYDPQFPESADFAGLMVDSIEFTPAVENRPFQQNIANGATFGRLRLSGRTIVVSGWLIGRTCCSVNYGLKWLSSALIPTCITESGCGGAEACFLSCCPSLDPPIGALTICEGGDEGEGEIPGDEVVDYHGRDNEESEFQRGFEFFRKLQNVSLIAGPEILEREGDGDGCGCTQMVRVEFTLGVGNPYVFEDAAPCIVDAVPPPCRGPILPCISPTELPDCPTFEDCLDDPLCPTPQPPIIPVPVSDCVCIAQSTSRVTCQIEAPAGGDWFDATTIIEVKSGSEPLRNLAVRMWQNSLGHPCNQPEFFNDCLACSTLHVTYVPPNSILEVNGVTRRNTITCGLTKKDASRSLYTLRGQPFTPMDLSCQPACIAVDFDCSNSASDAMASVWVVRRALW